MKKTLLAGILGCVLLITGCSSDKDETADKPKEEAPIEQTTDQEKE